MDTRAFRAPGLQISAIGFGALHLSMTPRPSLEESIKVLHHAFSRGITLIDTADSYCTDESDKHVNEILVCQALRTSPRANSVVVATKGGMIRPGGAWIPRGDPQYLLRTIRESFEALGGEKPIDLWQYHAPDPRVEIGESLEAVAKACKSGLIRHVGLSNVSLEQIKRARDIVEIVSIQKKYNLWHRSPELEGILDYCEQERLIFMPWAPFGGIANHRELQQLRFLREVAGRHEVSVYCVALAWILSKSKCIVPIPGTSKIAHLDDWIQACELKLSADDIYRIECSVYRAVAYSGCGES